MSAAPFAQELRALLEAEAGFARAEGLLAGGRSVLAQGLPGGALTTFLAALARRRPLLVVLPAEDELGGLQDDLEGLCDGGAAVLRNPSLDLFEEEDEDGEDELGGGAALVGARLHVLHALAHLRPAPLVLTGITALLQKLPGPGHVAGAPLELRRGGELDPALLARRLVEAGCERVALVAAPGEFAIRGGIVDLWPLGAPAPLRAELFGDTIESLRRFEPESQRSSEELERFTLPLLSPQDYRRLRHEDGASLLDHLPPDAAVVLVRPGQGRARLAEAQARFRGGNSDLLALGQVEAALGRRPLLLVGEGAEDDPAAAQAEPVALPFAPAWLMTGTGLESVTNELARRVARGERVTIACTNEAERERLLELFGQAGLQPEADEHLRQAPAPPGLSLLAWSLGDGFVHEAGLLTLLPSHRLFSRHRRGETDPARARPRRGGGTAIESFSDLEPGQPVVHVSYGIALFQGIVRRERDGQPRDFLRLEFDGGELYIPTDRIGLIRRYIGPSGAAPRLSKLGGTGWRKKTAKAQEAVRDLAAELLEVQAERSANPGHAFPPDDASQLLFEESFAYTDTDDQVRVTAEVKRDMETPRAMDRLVCGDVGYGKTEIAIRAAFKCVQAGRQVAVLVPTTVLAHQHERTFRERLAPYPIRVEAVSRFLSQAEQRRIIKDAAAGKVDVLIGTHRLLSADVAFRELGLVVVDEEQRFGVEHKERLKLLRRTVDLLTLSATPIPRTLHLALSGARDISVLQTPPPGRSPVATRVVTWNDTLLRRAIERELARDGQVFFVHDRVRSIDNLAHKVQELVPTARVLVVHGQLPEQEIERRMLRFVDHEADVLVATTLIENGLDIRRANTIIIDRAHHYGLAELHQLRGRVGRSDLPAWAYLIAPAGGLSDVARRRLRAIEEFTDLGAGFHIALRDLEIRGAGNVLGAEQSGHIADVGYDLYCRLLRRAVAELRGQLTGQDAALDAELDPDAAEVEVVLDVPAYVPDAYLDDVALKIDCYRKLAGAEAEADLDRLEDELRDRYGPLPEVLANLFRLRRLRLRAAGRGVLKIGRQDRVLQLRCRERERLEAGIRSHRRALRPIDRHMLYVVMPDPEAPDEDQLRFLLELLAPLGEDEAPQPAGLDPQRLRKERQRRLRARQAKREGEARRAVSRPRRPGPP